MKKRLQQGFTLIELLVVVAIIAILALVVMLALNPVEMQRRSRDSRRLSDLGTVRRALDLALVDGASLKGTTTTLYTNNTGASGALDATSLNNLVGVDISKYLATIPQDPQFGATGTNIQTTNGTCGATPGTAPIDKAAMVYSFSSNGDTYEINAYLESTDNCAIPKDDGGNNAAKYEMGTKLTLMP
jgi:prepilin-type N-terminal cleavage/methylation domain-containing protein